MSLAPLHARYAIVNNQGVITPQFLRWVEELRNSIAGVPVGTVASHLSANTPAGWLLCAGQLLSRRDYPALYQAIGSTFGGDATSFNLPDLRDRFLIGAGSILSHSATGGASTITLSVANLPAHSHTITDAGHTHNVTDAGHGHTVTDPGHTHTVTDPGHSHTSGEVDAGIGATGGDIDGATSGTTSSETTGLTVDSATTGLSVNNGTTGVSVDSGTTGISIDDTGSGTAFDAIPPAVGVNWIIKI